MSLVDGALPRRIGINGLHTNEHLKRPNQAWLILDTPTTLVKMELRVKWIELERSPRGMAWQLSKIVLIYVFPIILSGCVENSPTQVVP